LKKKKTIPHSNVQSPYTFSNFTEREAELANVKIKKKGSVDTESLTSNCSVSSWTSCANNAFTPPITPVYSQALLKDAVKETTYPFSSETIDLVDFDECMGLTPNPEDIERVPDDIDAFLAELVSFGSPQEPVQINEPSLDELAETLFSNDAAVKADDKQDEPATVEEKPKTRKARGKAKKKTVAVDEEVVAVGDSPPKRPKIGPESIPVYLGIELPAKRKPPKAKAKPSTAKTKPSTPKKKPAGPKVKPSTPKTKRSSPQKAKESTSVASVSFQFEDGMPVFVIPLPELAVEKEPPKAKAPRKKDLSSTTTTKRSLKMMMDSRAPGDIVPSTAPSPKPKAPSRPRKSKNEKDSFDLQSLVDKFRRSSKMVPKSSSA